MKKVWNKKKKNQKEEGKKDEKRSESNFVLLPSQGLLSYKKDAEQNWVVPHFLPVKFILLCWKYW